MFLSNKITLTREILSAGKLGVACGFQLSYLAPAADPKGKWCCGAEVRSWIVKKSGGGAAVLAMEVECLCGCVLEWERNVLAECEVVTDGYFVRL